MQKCPNFLPMKISLDSLHDISGNTNHSWKEKTLRHAISYIFFNSKMNSFPQNTNILNNRILIL